MIKLSPLFLLLILSSCSTTQLRYAYPDGASRSFYSACEAYDAKNFKKAVDLFDQSITLDSALTYPEAFVLLARAREAGGGKEPFVSTFYQAFLKIDENPNSRKKNEVGFHIKMEMQSFKEGGIVVDSLPTVQAVQENLAQMTANSPVNFSGRVVIGFRLTHQDGIADVWFMRSSHDFGADQMALAALYASLPTILQKAGNQRDFWARLPVDF